MKKTVIQVRLIDDAPDDVARREVLVASFDAPPAYAVAAGRLDARGHQGAINLAAGLRRAIEDAEALAAGRDPERPSEKAMRLSQVARP